MNKAKLIFKQHKDSFSVDIENMEQLTVEDIQKIERFVYARKGVFDFETYSFSIQKRLNFEEFVSLLQHSDIDAVCSEKYTQTDLKAKVEFGKYKGMCYSELPESYLLWLRANYRGKDRDVIISELNQRGLF